MSRTGGFNRTIKITIGISDIFLYHLSFILSFYIRYKGDIPLFNYSAYRSVLPYVMLIFVIINIFSGIYTLYNKKVVDMFSITIISQFMMSLSIMALTFFGRWFAFPRTIIFINLIISTIVLALWRWVILEIYYHRSGVSRVMVVGTEEDCKEAVQNFKSSESRQYKIVAATFDNYSENIKKNIDDIETFYIMDFSSLKEEEEILSYLTLNNKRIFLGTNFGNLLRTNNRIMNIDDESLLAISRFEITPENDTIKRMLDIIISFLMICITMPIMLITAILIKITSKGPILYKQIRITKGEKEFKVWKFRSMRTDAEDISGPVLAQAEDPRVTKVGKYIRSLRIDELPQLFNVLKGDMSLIGPRPERPFFVNQFKEVNPYYYLRHNVRAGITGYAQVYGKYTTDFNSKLRFDLLYIKNYSLMLDIQILFQTIKILFDKVSSQGLEEQLSGDNILDDIKIFK